MAARFHDGRRAVPHAVSAVVPMVVLVTAAPGLLAPLVPAVWEERAGAWAVDAATSGHRVCEAAAGQRALDRFAARLTQVAELRPIRLLVVDDPAVNAFTLPGRWVLLDRGLVETAEDGDELAGFLSDHPSTAERRKAASQPPDGAPAFGEDEWRAIRAMCAGG